MDANGVNEAFQTVSQRVASTYCRMLADFAPVELDGLTDEQQADLHAFFQSLYDALYAAPEQFGLPVAKDAFIVVDHDKEGPGKAEVNRQLEKPRKLVNEGLDFLSSVGTHGWLEEQALTLGADDPALAFLKKKTGRAWVQGMERAGLALREAGDVITVSNVTFPQMMPALQTFAKACVDCTDPNLGRVFFARCDLRALQHEFKVEALDLFRILKPEGRAWAAEMHAYFTGRDYKPLVEIGRMFSWVVKYQGKKSIKATPFFQVEFDERLLSQMRAGIKCVSAQRIVPLISTQSQALQDDFARRSNRCADCDWCRNQKTLGPVEYEYRGEKRTICWYVNYDLNEFTSETIRLVHEYTVLHESL